MQYGGKMNVNRLIAGFALFLTLTLSGCGAGIDPIVAESPEYHSGYTDGCITANDRQNGYGSKVTRDLATYESSEAYRTGWRSGYGACGGQISNPRDYNEDQWY